jgi:tRNA nucleotidyltransferase/poly(A) polymerase
LNKINFTDLIPSNIKEIIETLTENNFPAYIVGGACREFLLGNYSEIHDFDIVTKATPQEIKELFPKVTTCGNSFLVSLVNGIEVATTRADKKDGAEQSFSFFTDSESNLF